MLYEMAYGRAPYVASTTVELSRQIKKQRLRFPEDVVSDFIWPWCLPFTFSWTQQLGADDGMT